MTNEELAMKAKCGGETALLELWEQNSGLAAFFARSRYNRLELQGNMRGVDIDDLKQAAFLALVQAVNYYDPDKEFSFNSYWANCIKREYSALLGVRTSKRDPLNNCTSLDTPLSDEADSETLGDIIPDPTDDFEIVDERIYRAQRTEILQRELKKLSEAQQHVLQLIYYKGLKQGQAAKIMGVSKHKVDTLEHTAIFALRRQLRGVSHDAHRQNAI